MKDSEIKSFRKQDTIAENHLARYMDNFFYDKLEPYVEGVEAVTAKLITGVEMLKEWISEK